MNIKGKAAVITGAGSGIGQAIAIELAERGIGAVGLVDRSDNVINVARLINDRMDRPVAEAMIGDVTDTAFRQKVYDLMCSKYGAPAVCVPAAGITRDRLAVKMDKQTGTASIYPIENFRLVMEVNLVAPSTGRSRPSPGSPRSGCARARAAGPPRKGSRERSSSSVRSRRRASPARSPTRPPRPHSRASRPPCARKPIYHGVRLRHHPPGLHRHPDGPRPRAGVHR